MTLPLKPTYPPMEALSVSKIPTGPRWQYEPKWDGFRCLVFKDESGEDSLTDALRAGPVFRLCPASVASSRRPPRTQGSGKNYETRARLNGQNPRPVFLTAGRAARI